MTIENLGAKLRAIIDVGSNSVRIMVYSDGKILLRDLVTTQLIKDISDDKKLAYRSINRTLDGISSLKKEAETFGKVDFYCFATAAVRNAKNCDEFCAELKNRLGLKVHVLSGEQEAAMGLYGALGGDDGLVIDVGGGSTEVIAASGGRVIYSLSVPCGAVVLSDNSPREEKSAILAAQSYINSFDLDFLADFCSKNPALKPCAIGGTANSLAFIAMGGGVYDRARQDGYVITLTELETRLSEFFSETAEELCEKYNLDLRRANVLPFGTALIYCILRGLNANAASLCESDNLEGYMHYLNGEKLYEF